jgi:inorganic pyrophosphatase
LIVNGDLNVVIDIPKGSRNKYALDFELMLTNSGQFCLTEWVFPFDFGSIPSTDAEDGNPLGVLVLMDEPTFGEA